MSPSEEEEEETETEEESGQSANHKICNGIKQNESEVEKIFLFVLFLAFFVYYCTLILFGGTPHGGWEIGSKITNSWRVAKKVGNKETICFVFYVFKSVFTSYDSFCLITSHTNEIRYLAF